MMAELGLRYEPSGQADLQAHAARIALLAQDCADLPPLKLRLAIARWVQNKPFLPKASELRAIVDDIDSVEWRAKNNPESLQIWCDEQNDFAKRIGADWWYYVTTIDRGGVPIRSAEKLEGWRAIEARNRAEGKLTERYKPTPEDLASINAFVRQQMDNGLSQDEFDALVRRTGGAPRA